jgi:uncharacterized protein (TIGR02268 family)
MEREGARCLELEARPSEGAPAVGLSPESSTTLMFDADLVREEVALEERERFAFVDVGERSIVLQPSSQQRTEKPLRLEVRFRGGQSPERTVLWLTVGPEQAEARVRVLRQRRCTEETMRAELARLQEENQRLRAELERRNETPGPVSLIQLRTEGRIDAAGVVTRDIRRDVRFSRGVGLSGRDALSHRTQGRVAVELVLRNADTAEPWSVDKAALVGLPHCRNAVRGPGDGARERGQRLGCASLSLALRRTTPRGWLWPGGGRGPRGVGMGDGAARPTPRAWRNSSTNAGSRCFHWWSSKAPRAA